MALSDYTFGALYAQLQTLIQNNFVWIVNKLTQHDTAIGNKASQTDFTTHTGNTTVHISTEERDTWNNKQDALSATQLSNIADIQNKANSSDLLNYYTKTETNNLLTNKIRKEVVDTLPAVADAEENIIYLVPNSSGTDTNNVKDEYMLIDGKYEKIGSTSVDLSNYYTKTQIDTIFSDIAQNGLNTITAIEE